MVSGKYRGQPKSNQIDYYAKGYYIIWAFYSSLHVETKNENYVFDFDSALVAVGGSLGLFLGWSCQSFAMSFIDLISDQLTKGADLLSLLIRKLSNSFYCKSNLLTLLASFFVYRKH